MQWRYDAPTHPFKVCPTYALRLCAVLYPTCSLACGRPYCPSRPAHCLCKRPPLLRHPASSLACLHLFAYSHPLWLTNIHTHILPAICTLVCFNPAAATSCAIASAHLLPCAESLFLAVLGVSHCRISSPKSCHSALYDAVRYRMCKLPVVLLPACREPPFLPPLPPGPGRAVQLVPERAAGAHARGSKRPG